MKKIILTTAFLAVGYALNAQVIITDAANPSPTNSSVLLEFGSENKGIILPSVASAPNAAAGTFIVNTTTQSVRVSEQDENEDIIWKDLTDEGEAVEHIFVNAGVSDIAEGVIIGAETSDKPGILVLESTTQALVLPKVDKPHENIQSPVAGTLVYDTDSNTLAVYDGASWSYWK